MSFIGEEGGKGGRSSNGREEEVRRRLEEGRRADQDGRRASGEKERASKGDGRSDGSQVSNELRGRSEQKSGSVAVSKLGGREVAPRKDDKSGRGGGEEQLRRVPYLQVSNQSSFPSDKLCKCALFSLLLLLQAVRQLTGSQGLDRDLCHQVFFYIFLQLLFEPLYNNHFFNQSCPQFQQWPEEKLRRQLVSQRTDGRQQLLKPRPFPLQDCCPL